MILQISPNKIVFIAQPIGSILPIGKQQSRNFEGTRCQHNEARTDGELLAAKAIA
jgi:hypothetical protein